MLGKTCATTRYLEESVRSAEGNSGCALPSRHLRACAARASV